MEITPVDASQRERNLNSQQGRSPVLSGFFCSPRLCLMLKEDQFIYAQIKTRVFHAMGPFHGTINTIQCKLRKLRYQIKKNKTDLNLDNIFLLLQQHEK